MILRLDDGLRLSGSELIDADIIIPIKLYPGQARSERYSGGLGRRIMEDLGMVGF